MLLRAVEHEDRQRAVGLLDLGEPLLPALPQVVHRLEPGQPVHARDHHDRRRRGVGADLEQVHEELATRERAVDRGQVRDQEGDEGEADGGLDERDDLADRRRWPQEPEREQRRAAGDHRVHRRLAEHPVDRGEPERQQDQPPGGQQDQGDRAVVGHDPVPELVRARRRRHELERGVDHPEREARQRVVVAARDDERADGAEHGPGDDVEADEDDDDLGEDHAASIRRARLDRAAPGFVRTGRRRSRPRRCRCARRRASSSGPASSACRRRAA